MKAPFSLSRVWTRFVRGAALAAVLGTGSAWTQENDPSEAEIQEIIRKFAAKESEFARARENFTYRQSVKLQEFEGASPGGKYELVSDIIFDQGGKRNEVILRAPVTTLRQISISPEDEQDLRNVLPFVLTSEDIDKYHVHYLGRQKADEIPCYVFAVKPKTMARGTRYFTGLIWVDDQDLQIVKSYGRSTGVLAKGSDQAFMKFETYRDQVDGKFWFPVYTISEDVLQFDNGNRVPIKATVKYENYQQFNVDVKITLEDEPIKPSAPKPKP